MQFENRYGIWEYDIIYSHQSSLSLQLNIHPHPWISQNPFDGFARLSHLAPILYIRPTIRNQKIKLNQIIYLDQDQDQEPRNGRLRLTAVARTVFGIFDKRRYPSLPLHLNAAALNIQRAVSMVQAGLVICIFQSLGSGTIILS